MGYEGLSFGKDRQGAILALGKLTASFKHSYEKYWASRLSKASRERFLPGEIFESIAPILRKGEKLLDVGCGNGALMEIAKVKFDEVHGYDISETALQEARRKGMRAICVDLNAGPSPYQNESFDVITCLEVAEHMVNPLHFLRDLYRILRPRGQMVLTTPNIRYFRNLTKLIFKGTFPHTSACSFVWGGGHLHYFTRKDLAFLLQEAGFERIRFHLNEKQFIRSWKRQFILRLTGKSIFGEWFCGGIIVSAYKER